MVLPAIAAAFVVIGAVAMRMSFGPGDEPAEDRRKVPLLVEEVELEKKYKFEVHDMVGERCTSSSPVKIHTKYYYPNADKPKGVVIYLHGLNSHSGRITPFYRRSLNDGWIVGMMDFRGFGRSSGRHGYIEDVDILAQDAVKFIKETKTKFPHYKVFVLGTSMGALTLLHASIKLPPGIVDSMIYHAPPVEISPNVLPSAPVEVLGRILLYFIPKLPFLVPHSVHSNSPGRESVVEHSKDVDPNFYRGRLRIGTAYAMMQASIFMQENSSGITLPFLLIHGTADRVCAYDGSERFFAKASSTDKKLFAIPNGQHNLLQEEEQYKQLYLDTISNWIETRVKN
ncbi:lipase [Thraustotheca clavata]|uniref:Lipase n=1 Tax=Thraustotheca clavata TaxID=74557 RepID=A0A1V9ZQR8_9STRA|nr:lipase [Thraustotheca clavata]